MYPVTPPNPEDKDDHDDLADFLSSDSAHDDDLDTIEVIVNENGTQWGEDDDAEEEIDPNDFAAALSNVPGTERVAQAFMSFMRRGVHAPDVALLSDLDREGARAFERAWRELDERTRGQVIRWMVDLSEDRFDLNFSRLFRSLLDDSSPTVRQLAITGLWEDDTDEMRARMIASLHDDPSPDVRAEAARFLSRLADEVAAGETNEPEGFTDLLLSIARDETEAVIVRRRALETAGVLAARGSGNSAEAIRGLIAEAYESDESELRAAALYAMGRTLDRRWLATITGELKSEDAEMRYEAVRAAGEMAESSLVADVSELVDDEDAEVRSAVIASLGQIGGQGAVRVLRTLAADKERNDLELVEEALSEALISVDPLRPGR